MARKIEIDFRKAYVSDHLPTIDANQAASESAQRTYQDVLNSIVKDITMGDSKEIKRALKSVSNLDYVETVKYPVKDVHLFEGQYDNTGDQILMCEPSILYHLDSFSNYSEGTHELYVFVDGKKLLPENYKVSKNYGGLRIYIKTAFVSNNSEVTFVGNRVYRESKRTSHNVATTGTGYKFSVHLEKVGYFHRSPSNYLVFRKATGTNYFKHLSNYSVSRNRDNGEYIDILVDETLSAGDNLMVLNNNSFFKEIINPVASYDLTTGANRDLPLPIGMDKELELFCNGKLLQQGVDYSIDWAEGNNTVPPRINITPVPSGQVEIIANDCYAPSTVTVTNDVLPAHGVIPLLTSYPVALGYLDVYVNGLRVATSNLEVVADNVLKVVNVTGSLVTVKIRVTDSEMATEAARLYSINKPDLAKFIEHVGVVNYIAKYVANDKTGIYNFTDGNYPSTDEVISTDEVNKYKPESVMNDAVNDLIAGDPNRFKKVLENLSMNYHQREFSYPDKARHRTTVPVGLSGMDLKAGDSVILYLVDDFGKFGEDSYNMEIFADGRKLARRHYIAILSNEGMKIYVKDSKISNGTKLFIAIETIYRNDGFFKHPYTAVAPFPATYTFNADLLAAGSRRYSIKDYILYVKGSRNNFYKPMEASAYTVEETADINVAKVTVNSAPHLLSDQQFLIINRNSYFRYEYNAPDVDEATYLKGDPFVSFDLVKRIGDEWIPLPVTNSNELTIYNNGTYLIEGDDYTFHWNLDNDLSPPRIFMKGVPRLGTTIEMVSTQPFYEGISQNIVVGNVPSKGMVKLDMPYPASVDFLEVFVNRKRVSTSQMEMLADNLLRIKGITGTDSLVIRAVLPDTARVRDIMAKYSTRKTDFEKYLATVGMDSFISKYVADKSVPNIVNSEPIENYVPVSNTSQFVDYQVFVDRWEEPVLDANDTFVNQKYFEQDFILDANTQMPFEGKRSIVDANDNSLTLTKYNFVE